MCVLCKAGVKKLRQLRRLRRVFVVLGASIIASSLAGCPSKPTGPQGEYNGVLAKKLERLGYYGSITGAKGQALSKPLAVAVGPGGRVYVADRKQPPPNIPLAALVTGRIQVFREKDGKFLFGFNRTTGNRALDLPSSIAVNPKDGNLFICDAGNKAVYEFTATGEFVRGIKMPREAGKAWSPVAVAIDGAGDLYVLDVGSKHRVIVFEGTAKVRKIFGKKGAATGPGAKPGSLWYPVGIAVASNGWVFVSDNRNQRIQLFDEEGEFERIIYTGGLPRGLAVAPDGLILVADIESSEFDLYTPEGEILRRYGEAGFRKGQFATPNGVALDAKSGWVFVADTQNNRVEVWAPRRTGAKRPKKK